MAEYIGLTVEDGFDLLRDALGELVVYAANHLEITILGLLTLLVLWNIVVRYRA